MIFSPTGLIGSYVIDLEPYTDDRGWFARTYCKDEFSQIGHTKEWIQLNHSLTHAPGTIRGMHFQRAPYGETKLIRCIAGAVFDVMIDLRRESSTFLHWFGVKLSAENKKMVYIPEGFAHGFQCLSENSELIYHHTRSYMPESEGGIRYDDAAVNIQWPLPVSGISERDKQHRLLLDNFNGI